MSAARRWVLTDVVFAGVTFLLVALTYTPLVGPLNELLCAVSYRGAGFVLSTLGVPFAADAAHRTLAHGPFTLEVTGLCSGMRGVALWGAVMMLLPGPRRQRAIHFALGTAVLVLVNVARIAHLYYLGANGSSRFTLFHEWVWPGAIVAGILLYRLVVRVAQPATATDTVTEVAHAA